MSHRPIAVVGAASSIGIKPYEDGSARQLDRAPGVLRQLALIERLKAVDLGDLTPADYRDFVRQTGRVRNEPELVTYCESLGERVAAAASDGRFVLVLGGDCSIVLGSLLAAKRVARTAGLAYIDAHADFAAPDESRTGSAASMCLGLAVGRGDTTLARLGGAEPLVDPAHVVLLGRRDQQEPWYGHAALAASRVLDIDDAGVRARGWAGAATVALERLGSDTIEGFWVHVDADVIDPSVMPAVDSPEAGGPTLEQLAALASPLVRHPRCIGLELTIYDPKLDGDRACAGRLVSLLEELLNPQSPIPE